MVVSSDAQTASAPDTMARLRSDGVNTVSLFVWWWQDSPQSTSISPYSGTETDAALSAEIAAARAAGLKVILVPIFYCGTCEGGWRGVIDPSDVGAWFSSYQVFIDHYAQLAQADGVWLLFAGSELTAVESYTTNWQQTISSVRQYFSGLVGYEQNWDVVGHPQFLADVDVVGVSAYFPLDDGADPSVSQLVADWSNSHASAYAGRNWVGDLTHLANATGKPILFGEVGYMDSTYAGKQPFLNSFYSADGQLQANLYQALLQTFSGYSWWMGVSWWEWSDNPADAQRTPMGHPAEQLLQKWYAQGWRPAPGTAGATGTGASGAGGPTTTQAGTAGAAHGASPSSTLPAVGVPGSVAPTAGGSAPAVGDPAGSGGTATTSPARVAPGAPGAPGTLAATTGAGRSGPPGTAAGGPAPTLAGSPQAAGAFPEAVPAAGHHPSPGFYLLAALAAVGLAGASAQLAADVVRRPEVAGARARRRAAVAGSVKPLRRR